MPDIGFFGPDSVAWRVHSSPSGMVGGIRSLMVQALQPRAMAGVAQHSVLRTDFWGRLRRTNDYLMTVVYGTKAEAELASAVVRRVHERVQGFDYFSRKPYKASDPELLTWVHNATVESYLHGYRRHGGHLAQADADAYVSEMGVLGSLMGVPAEELPHSEGELRRYFLTYAPNLEASPDAKEAVRILLNPDLPAKLRLLWSLPATDAYASLPREYQQMFGITWFPPIAPGVRIGTNVLLKGFELLLPPPPVIDAARRRVA